MEYDPPSVREKRGQYSLHQQCLMFMVHYGCLKVFTLGYVELGRPLEATGDTQRNYNCLETGCVCVFVCKCVCVFMSESWRKEGLLSLEGVLQIVRVCVCVCTVVHYVEWQVKEKKKTWGKKVRNMKKKKKKSCYSVGPARALRINLAGSNSTWS